MLAERERASGEQIVVVTLKSLQGYAIEDFGYQLGRYWGIGQKGRDNGAILLVAPTEHKVRIEVGYGLEGQLTDAQCRIIIEQVILPEFRRGDFNAGVLQGTQAILRVAGGGEPVAAGTQSNNPWLIAGLISIWGVFFFGIWGIFIVSFLRHHHDPNGAGSIPAAFGRVYPQAPVPEAFLVVADHSAAEARRAHGEGEYRADACGP